MTYWTVSLFIIHAATHHRKICRQTAKSSSHFFRSDDHNKPFLSNPFKQWAPEITKVCPTRITLRLSHTKACWFLAQSSGRLATRGTSCDGSALALVQLHRGNWHLSSIADWATERRLDGFFSRSSSQIHLALRGRRSTGSVTGRFFTSCQAAKPRQ